MTHHIWLAGWPKTVGGANTEAWHTIQLWRRNGCRVTVIPTWTATEPVRTRLETLGVEVVESSPDALGSVPGLRGAILVSFSNEKFLEFAHKFRDLGCRVIWASCMVWMFPAERLHYQAHGTFDAHLFQSAYQRDHLLPQLRYPRFHGFLESQIAMIPGAFDAEDFALTPLPHRPGERFVVGKLTRPAPEKFPVDLWAQVARIPYPTSIRVMGWDERCEAQSGPPPKFAEVLPEGAETTQEFLGKCHALVPGFQACPENWPRVGLEAMACGVPVVAQNRGGWCDMLNPEQPCNGRVKRQQVGDLVESIDEQAYRIARLAYDERFRMERIVEARWQLEHVVAHPELIWRKWDALFTRLLCKMPCSA